MGNDTLLTWATVVLAIVTGILVIVTAWYACQTQRIVKEMVKGRKLGPMPVLTCEMKCDIDRSLHEGGAHRHIVGEFNEVLVYNFGNAPAIETKVQLELANPTESVLRIPSKNWAIGTVGVQQRAILLATDQGTLLMQGHSDPQVKITLTYLNAYQQSFKIVATFELESHAIKPGETAPTGIWIKRDESTVMI